MDAIWDSRAVSGESGVSRASGRNPVRAASFITNGHAQIPGILYADGTCEIR